MDNLIGDRGGDGRGELGGKSVHEGTEDSGVREEGEGFNVLFDDRCGNRVYRSQVCQLSVLFGKIVNKKARTVSTPQPYVKHLLYYRSRVLCVQDTVIDRSDSPDGLKKKIKGLTLRLR